MSGRSEVLHPIIDEPELLKQFASAHRLDCPACDASLVGIERDECAACGQQLVLAVGLAEPRLGPFVLGLVFLAGAMGFSGIVLTYFTVRLLMRPIGVGYSGPGGFVLGALVAAIALTFWLKSRRAIVRARGRGPWAAAFGAMALAVVSVALLLATRG